MYEQEFGCPDCGRFILIESSNTVKLRDCQNCKGLKELDSMFLRFIALADVHIGDFPLDYKSFDQKTIDMVTMEIIVLMEIMGIFKTEAADDWPHRTHRLVLELNKLMGRFLENRNEKA